MSAHRYFADNCDIVGHQPGDRHRNQGDLDQEWTGTVWAPVCPVDDVPAQARDGVGWLCCGVCGTRVTEMNR